VPRDRLMAVYFIRKTDEEACIGCVACVDRWPVDAVRLEDGLAQVDTEWCIGCGVCAVVCPGEAISLTRRMPEEGPRDFRELHERMGKERGLW